MAMGDKVDKAISSLHKMGGQIQLDTDLLAGTIDDLQREVERLRAERQKDMDALKEAIK